MSIRVAIVEDDRAVRENLAARNHVVTAIDITDFGRHDPDLRRLGFSDRPALEVLLAERGIASDLLDSIRRPAGRRSVGLGLVAGRHLRCRAQGSAARPRGWRR